MELMKFFSFFGKDKRNRTGLSLMNTTLFELQELNASHQFQL